MSLPTVYQAEFDVDAFLIRFPEFTQAGPLVEQALADAALQVEPTAWGTRTGLAIHYLAADWLSNHPYGRTQRSEQKAEPSRYRVMYDNLFKQIRIGFLVT